HPRCPQYTHPAGFGDRRNHVAAMREGENGQFNPESVCYLRFHDSPSLTVHRDRPHAEGYCLSARRARVRSMNAGMTDLASPTTPKRDTRKISALASVLMATTDLACEMPTR